MRVEKNLHEEFPTFLNKSFGSRLETARDFIINSPQRFTNCRGMMRRFQVGSERFPNFFEKKKENIYFKLFIVGG